MAVIIAISTFKGLRRQVGLQVPSDKWADRYDHVHGYPMNYLLDAERRIMAHPRVGDPKSLRAFEMQIHALLAHWEHKVSEFDEVGQIALRRLAAKSSPALLKHLFMR